MLIKRNLFNASLLVFVLFIQACGSDAVKEAEKLIDAKEYEQAIEILFRWEKHWRQ